MPSLSPSLSSTAIAGEFEAVESALARVEPLAVTFDPSSYSPAAIATVRAQWIERMVVEHRSSMVFGQLAPQLFEANAPIDFQVVMLRMAQDELRHSRTCARVIEALGGVVAAEADFSVSPLARHGAASPEERALRNVLYTTSLSEMVACARFVATLEHTTDPFVRDATRRLLADEVLHGQFGFHYLDWARPWLDAQPDRKASIERYLVHAFAVIEGELAPRGPFAPLCADEKALGGNDPALAREVFYATMEGAVVPGLEQRGLDAGTSWRNRRRLA